MLSQQAATELWHRRQARKDPVQYVNYIDVPGKPVSEEDECDVFAPVETTVAKHHILILETLERISKTPHGRCMLFMPPGSAKSTYASVVFPSRYLGESPNRKLILASFGDSLAKKMGRRTRSILRQQRYKNLYNTELLKDSQAVNEFALTNASEYMATGILGGVTGNRAHGIIIDDPVKGREAADSETQRQKTWDAYEDDLKTRLVPGGWICIIQTRWHQDDLSGRILPDDWKGESGPILCQDGNIWEVICLQARCEVDNDPLGRKQGEYLWKEWFDEKHWSQFESNQRTWSALYQQLPSAREGNFFKPDNIEIIDAIPSEVKYFTRAWDFAATKDGGDFTANVKMGKMSDNRTLIVDARQLKEGPDGVELAVKSTAQIDGHSTKVKIPQDPGQAGKSQVKTYSKLLAGYNIIAEPVSGAKETRAAGFAAQVNVGNVLMLRGPWNKALIEELRVFPNGKNDDQVDAGSDAFNDIHSKSPGFFGIKRT